MLETVLSIEGFYFSTAYDLTHTLQRLNNTSPDFKFIPFHDRVGQDDTPITPSLRQPPTQADVRFLWNGFILRELAQQSELSSFCLPVMLGFVSIKTCNVQGRSFKYILISRRSCHRAGTRFVYVADTT